MLTNLAFVTRFTLLLYLSPARTSVVPHSNPRPWKPEIGTITPLVHPSIHRAAQIYRTFQRQPSSTSQNKRAGSSSYLQYLLARNRNARPALSSVTPIQQPPRVQGEAKDEKISFSWNTWSTWTSCSRSCEGGAQVRVRSCRRNGKRLKMSLFRKKVRSEECVGSAREYRACNTDPCVAARPLDDRKYKPRADQCASFNGLNYNGRKYEWLPYLRAGMDECRLYCMAKGHRMFVQLANQVEDGTPCGHNSVAVCLKGVCRETKPNEAPDKDSVTANVPNKGLEVKDELVDTVISRTFHSKAGLKLGYNLLFKIPAGAKNVHASEVRPSANFLALKVDGEFVLNGRWRIASSKTFKTAGAEWRYFISRRRRSQESLVCKGPIAEDVDLMILYQDESPKVLLNYTLALPVRKSAHSPAIKKEGVSTEHRSFTTRHTEFRWMTNGMTKCSRACDGGEQQLMFTCVSLTPSRTTRTVDSSNCKLLPQPPMQKRMCNMNPCPPRWMVLPWKPCSKKCGYGGVQLRDIRCQREMMLNGQKKTVNLPIRNCAINMRPAIHRPCPFKACNYEWKTGAWSECSSSCGAGVRKRVVNCMQENGVELAAKGCNPRTRPAHNQPCQLQPCTAFWAFSKWSECSSECGDGIKHRVVVCVDGAGIALPESECNEKTKPRSRIGCSSKECQTTWLTSPWTKCSSVCGEGFQSRVVACARLTDGRFNEVPDAQCTESQKPISKQRCDAGSCDQMWLMTDWTECSVKCGMGLQHRKITCFDRMAPGRGSCLTEERPPENLVCNKPSCRLNTQRMTGTPQASLTGSSRRTTEESITATSTAEETSPTPQVEVVSTTNPVVIATNHRTNSQSILKTTTEHTSVIGREIITTASPELLPDVKRTKTVSTTTERPRTQKPSTFPPTVAMTTTPSGPRCVDTRNAVYCRVIVRIPLCQYTLYRSRCCRTCADRGL